MQNGVVIRRLIFALLLLSSVSAFAQKYSIVDLRASGSQRYKPEEVIVASGLVKGQQASLDEVKAAAQKLSETGVFKEIAFRHAAATGGMRVEFIVKDADQFLPANFENIVWMSADELGRKLRERVPLFSGAVPPSGSLAEDVSNVLQAILAADAGVQGHVSYRLGGPRGQASDTVLYLVEDVDIKITQVGLTGNPAELDSETQKEAQKIVGTDYARSQLKYFVEHDLRSVYLRHGLLKAEFGDPLPKVLSNDGATTKVEVVFPVVAGKQYTLSALTWSGASLLPVNQLGSYLHLGGGAQVDAYQLGQDLAKIKEQYMRRGYMRAEVNALANFNDAQNTVAYQIAIIEGSQYKMGKLDVEGLAESSVEKLRNAWKLREGEPYDSTYVSQLLQGFRVPEGTAYKVEQEVDDANKVVDTTLIFRKAS